MKRNGISFLILCFFYTGVLGEVAPPVSIETKIMEKITKDNSVCANCHFAIQKISDPRIPRDLYEVTTFDIIPPPAWHVAVVNNKIYVLDHKQIDDWNIVMANNLPKIESDPDVISYAKFFLNMTMSQSQYIEKLNPSEVKKIEDKQKVKTDAQAKITRTDDKIQIQFYANDAQGDLQQWNLIFEKTGHILKLQERSF